MPCRVAILFGQVSKLTLKMFSILKKIFEKCVMQFIDRINKNKQKNESVSLEYRINSKRFRLFWMFDRSTHTSDNINNFSWIINVLPSAHNVCIFSYTAIYIYICTFDSVVECRTLKIVKICALLLGTSLLIRNEKQIYFVCANPFYL